jgi:hypothetical protein
MEQSGPFVGGNPSGAGGLLLDTVNFTAKAPPRTSVDIDPTDLLLFTAPTEKAAGSESKDVELIGAEVIVPIPAAVWLLGTGLFGLIALRRRYR